MDRPPCRTTFLPTQHKEGGDRISNHRVLARVPERDFTPLPADPPAAWREKVEMLADWEIRSFYEKVAAKRVQTVWRRYISRKDVAKEHHAHQKETMRRQWGHVRSLRFFTVDHARSGWALGFGNLLTRRRNVAHMRPAPRYMKPVERRAGTPPPSPAFLS